MTDADNALALATLDEITDELKRRSKGYALVMLLPSGNGEGPDQDELKYRWAGGSVQALGLVVLLKNILAYPDPTEPDCG